MIIYHHQLKNLSQEEEPSTSPKIKPLLKRGKIWTAREMKILENNLDLEFKNLLLLFKGRTLLSVQDKKHQLLLRQGKLTKLDQYWSKKELEKLKLNSHKSPKELKPLFPNRTIGAIYIRTKRIRREEVNSLPL